MPAIASRIFRVASLQPEPRLLVTFLVHIMQQRRVGIARQLLRQLIEPRKDRQQIRLWIRRRHYFDGVVQFHQRIQQRFFQRCFHAHSLAVCPRGDNKIRFRRRAARDLLGA